MAQQQSSRLHRLLTLLDTGSTQTTRFTAAQQIGDIAKSHPQELSSLLRKVSPYLRSKSWDTRVAAAHAVGAIAQNVKHTSLAKLFTCVEAEMLEVGVSGGVEDFVMSWTNFHPNNVAGLSFRSFDISKVLEFGALLASGGQEYDIAGDSGKSPGERLARQKQNLRRRLGLDVCEQFMDVSDMIRDEDLLVNKFNSPGNGSTHRSYTSHPKNRIQQLVANMVPGFMSKRPSAREMNLLKRKAKINAKDQTKGWSDDVDSDAQNPQQPVIPKVKCPEALGSNKMFMDPILDEDCSEYDGDGRWPFQNFVELLIIDLFDPIWEVRHGSMMALREILTQQGGSAGVSMSDLSSEDGHLDDIEQNHNLNTLKRERELDLNVQVAGDDFEPSKRLKSEDGFKSENTLCPMNETTLSNGEVSVCLKMEDAGCSLTPLVTNGILDVGNVKVEPEVCLDRVEVGSIEEQNRSIETTTCPISKTEIPQNIPGNCKLMKLVKVTSHSWIKNWEFLQDCAIRFLCVLSLDRFGDYVSDQVVAPVRETCAQALGAVLKYMHPSLVHETLQTLLQMQCRPEWEIRHGSLLGIKYMVAVRQDMLNDLLDCVLPACKAGLEDPDDDVRAVAADALIPAAAAIVSLNGQVLNSIVMLLWDILLDLDDLSPSTSSVMNLLAEIYSREEMIPKMLRAKASKEKQKFDLNEVILSDEHGDGAKSDDNPYMLATLAPRLWPFMRHAITSVRHSAIRTLERLLEAGCQRSSELETGSFWPSFILGDTLRIVFQNLLLEANEEILQCSERVWRLLLQCPEKDLEVAGRSYFTCWIELAITPYGSVLDATKMFWPVALPRKSHFRAAAKMRAMKQENEFSRNFAFDAAKGTTSNETNGVASANFIKIIVGADSEKSVTRTRVVTAAALGIFASKLPHGSLQFVIDPLWKEITSFSGVQRQVASMIFVSWFKELQSNSYSGMHEMISGFLDPLKKWLFELLTCADPSLPTKDSTLPYTELSRTYAKMRSEANLLYVAVDSSGLSKSLLPDIKFDMENLSVDDSLSFASKLAMSVNDPNTKEIVERHILEDLESSRQRLIATSGYLKCIQNNLHVTVSSLIAAAVVWMSGLPTKLNPIILPLMASIKREQEEILQQKAAEALAELISRCVERRKGVTGAQPGPVLTWAQRVKIAVGAARGLEYLHEKAQPHIIHRDIKSSNVLLFDDDVAKIADFDLSNQAPDMAARLHSTRVLGTFGYHAPEYAMTGQLNSKSDVYSFGVVLLELLTGRKPVDHTLPRGQQSLVTWATPRLSEDKVRQCIDQRQFSQSFLPLKLYFEIHAQATIDVRR